MHKKRIAATISSGWVHLQKTSHIKKTHICNMKRVWFHLDLWFYGMKRNCASYFMCIAWWIECWTVAGQNRHSESLILMKSFCLQNSVRSNCTQHESHKSIECVRAAELRLTTCILWSDYLLALAMSKSSLTMNRQSFPFTSRAFFFPVILL